MAEHKHRHDAHGRQLRFVAPLPGGRLSLAGVTPLNNLLLQAIEIAKRREPGLSDSEIAYRAGITQPTLSRAKKRCGPSTLGAVLDTLGIDLVLAAPNRQRGGPKSEPRLVARSTSRPYESDTLGLSFPQKAHKQ